MDAAEDQANPLTLPWLLRCGRAGRMLVLAGLLAAMFVVSLALACFATELTGEFNRGPLSNNGLTWAGAFDPSLWVRVAAETASTLIDLPPKLLANPVQSLIYLLGYFIGAASLALLAAPAVGTRNHACSPRSLRASMIGAALLAGLVSMGILVTAWDWLSFLANQSGSSSEWTHGAIWIFLGWPLAGGWLAFGLVWAWLLRRAGATRNPAFIDRMVRRLFAGSALELGLAAPTYAVMARRDNCYCSWGSWWAIVAGLISIVLLCGPWAMLLATRKVRMQWMRGTCGNCGYPLRTGSAVCPECGVQAHWNPETATRA